ncbi:DNA gyrase inhibitor [Romboutsia weinsteinii]|uniref:DNA gyrase inhibitor n=1 Tax=Romboutsia weinsteinii TaxID=2020949 RepID=A0A255IPA5_9FIRM|nr:GyrI-like domain-containing protein [Romboutsia weinsteinii]RDY27748.1 DNA gyrase inhibitor [Romboutsia weinsteinii]
MRVEKLEKCRVAYMRRVGAYGVENFQLMRNLKKWASDNNLFTEDAVIYGIAQDNPEITPLESCRYDVCIVIPNEYEVNNLVEEMELEGGEYAVYKINHTTEDVKKAWGEIFNDLQQKGYIIDNKPTIERYSKEMIDNEFCEICVPIKKYSA